MDYETCKPRQVAGSYKGWHQKSLRKYNSIEEANKAAESVHGKVFYCEYGHCWHVGRK